MFPAVFCGNNYSAIWLLILYRISNIKALRLKLEDRLFGISINLYIPMAEFLFNWQC